MCVWVSSIRKGNVLYSLKAEKGYKERYGNSQLPIILWQVTNNRMNGSKDIKILLIRLGFKFKVLTLSAKTGVRIELINKYLSKKK